MKTFKCFIFLSFVTICSLAQPPNKKNDIYLKASGGRVSFGTGDLLGYSVGMDVSKNVIKTSRWGLHKLLIGGEFIFENGVKNPVIQNPTIDEFFQQSFGHSTNAIIWAKGAWYPFKKIVSGFNIQLGPTVGYAERSRESTASRVDLGGGDFVRRSTLFFDNGFVTAYRISTSIEFDITKKWQAGFRLDFSNNNKGDANTLAGLKFGVRL